MAYSEPRATIIREMVEDLMDALDDIDPDGDAPMEALAALGICVGFICENFEETDALIDRVAQIAKDYAAGELE